MGKMDARAVPDMLLGLAPAAAGACPRCGTATRGLANGRGRLDICGACGTIDLHSPEGIDVLSLRGTPLAPGAPSRRDDPFRLPARASKGGQQSL